MGWRKQRSTDDPFEARSRELADQIRKLEKQIDQLAHTPPPAPAPTRSRSPSRPVPPNPSPAPTRTPQSLPPAPAPSLPLASPTTEADGRINPQGLRKFDLSSVWRRIQVHFQGPNTNNPRMVQYLAAGSVHGLRPLRYEKRVARNRFIGLFLLLVLILFGLARVYFPQR